MEEELLYFWQNFGVSSATSIIISILMAGIWSVIFYFWQKSIDNKYQKQLENLKAKNDKINYISKTQFDAEFVMYKELSKATYKVKILFVDYLKRILDKSFDANFVESYKNVAIEITDFQEILASYSPFINKNLNEHFENFRMYVNKKIKFIQIESEKEIKKEITENEFIKSVCSVKFEKIEQLHENIVNNLRAYLQSLKVQEE